MSVASGHVNRTTAGPEGRPLAPRRRGLQELRQLRAGVLGPGREHLDRAAELIRQLAVGPENWNPTPLPLGLKALRGS